MQIRLAGALNLFTVGRKCKKKKKKGSVNGNGNVMINNNDTSSPRIPTGLTPGLFLFLLIKPLNTR